MLRRGILSAPGSIALISISLSHAVTSFSSVLKLKPGSRSVRYAYKPVALAEYKEYNAVEIAANMEKRRYPPGREGESKRFKEEQDRGMMIDGSPDKVLDLEAKTLLERLQTENVPEA